MQVPAPSPRSCADTPPTEVPEDGCYSLGALAHDAVAIHEALGAGIAVSQRGRSFVYMVERYAASRKDGAMLTEERVIPRPIDQGRLEAAEPPVPIRREARPEFSVRSLLRRILVVALGFGLAFTGWMLMMTVILVFIGLPLFIFGVAVMQTQER